MRVCNHRPNDVLREALAGEVAGGLRAGPSARDDARRTLRFRRQARDRLVDELGGDACPGELVPDELVARAALDE